MFGALPAALTCYWRIKMPEMTSYTTLVVKIQLKLLHIMDMEAEAQKLAAQISNENASPSANDFFSRVFESAWKLVYL